MKTLEERKTYWMNQLSGVPAPLALPSDRERPPVSSFLRETASLALAPDLCLKLKALAAQEAVSVFSVLMAVFASVLSRYTGQMEIVSGTLLWPVGNLEQPARAILRTRTNGDQTIRTLVRHDEAAVSEAAAVGDCPLSSLTALRAHVDGTPDAPLFSTGFVFSGSSPSEPQAVSDPSRSGFAEDFARCDLVVVVRSEKDGLAVECDYDAELFNASTIGRFLKHFGNLIGGMIAEPASSLASV